MTATVDPHNLARGEQWERELCAAHRWGQPRHGERIVIEKTHLRAMWDIIAPGDRPSAALLEQIIALEVCNWNLESGVLALCGAIGSNEPAHCAIGHLSSCTEERWRKIWAYYLALLDWLPHEESRGISALMSVCDAMGTIADHVSDLLGEVTPLKTLFVERFALTLECWLHGLHDAPSDSRRGSGAAIERLEADIRAVDHDAQLLEAVSHPAGLFPCHHKLFRRYAIILSSIGVGKWRGAMPVSGDGPRERARTVESLLQPVEAWLAGVPPPDAQQHAMLFHALGKPTPSRRFLAAFLCSLLRSQLRSA